MWFSAELKCTCQQELISLNCKVMKIHNISMGPTKVGLGQERLKLKVLACNVMFVINCGFSYMYIFLFVSAEQAKNRESEYSWNKTCH